MDLLFTPVFVFFLGLFIPVQAETNGKFEEPTNLSPYKSSIVNRNLSYSIKIPHSRDGFKNSKFIVNQAEDQPDANGQEKIIKPNKIKFNSDLERRELLMHNFLISTKYYVDSKEKSTPDVKYKIKKRSINASDTNKLTNASGVNDISILINDSSVDFSSSAKAFERLTLKSSVLFNDILDSVSNDFNISCLYPDMYFENITSESVVLATNFTSPFCVCLKSYEEDWCIKTSSFCINYSITTLGGLCPFTNYTVFVLMNCPYNISLIEVSKISTLSSKPDKPENVNVLTTDSTADITWNPPYVYSGPIIQYTILCEGPNYSLLVNTSETEFTIEKLLPYTNYSFMVAGYTSAGQGEWSNKITKNTKVGLPSQPVDLRNTSLTNTSVVFEWKEPTIFAGPIICYTVQLKIIYCILIGGSQSSFIECTEEEKFLLNKTETRLVISGLVPYTNYTFSVAAVTEAGTGNWTEYLWVRTLPGVPDEPTAISVSTTNISAYISWQPPNRQKGPLTSYVVRWNCSNDALSIRTKETRLRIENLKPYTVYTFRVAAETSAGQGKWSEPMERQTKIGVPEKPIIRISTKSGVFVSWTSSEKTTGYIDYYTVFYHEVHSTSDPILQITNVSFIEIEDLKPYTFYTFKVAATSIAGQGEWSDPKDVRTAIGVPFPPRNVAVTAVTNISLTLTWDEPFPFTGPIESYQIRSRDFPDRWIHD